ncbi:hypothetical protein [Streptomyces lomondensis]|uniref:Small secreted hydrophilic protein n=1 Tax=Streptomyces lomondensis TaxID=68229 RepID=A0ABQ2XTI5_9ACTN|nr:hypothetical protein [Streptomyces lomondensis]MCF0082455.1 hypothetical protein [Streptomyces lomondensis]GGX33599.1 hypothetical protein GCM10010383_74870 [Streptomyces lomondensis]
MTRSQRLAALAAGALLLVGIPVSGAHQRPPPDLGEPVVVERTGPGPGPARSSVPSPDSRATERTPTRSPTHGATTPSEEYAGEDAVPPAGAEQPNDTDPEQTDTAQPVPPKSPVPAGESSDDDPTPTYSPAASATSRTPSTPADDGDDDDTGGDD